MTRDELLFLVKKVYAVDGTEKEIDNYVHTLDLNVPHPNIIDLIYWPPENKNLTPEEVVDIALSYDRKSNQKILCSESMNELLKDYEPGVADTDFAALFRYVETLDMSPRWVMKGGKNPKKIAAHNKIKLDFCKTFGEMLDCCVKLEEHLMEFKPNLTLQSYFTFKNNKGVFTFHAEAPNVDYILDELIPNLDYPLRKNTF